MVIICRVFIMRYYNKLIFIPVIFLFCYSNSLNHFFVLIAYLLVLLLFIYSIYKFVQSIKMFGFSAKHLQIVLVVLAILGFVVWIDVNWINIIYSYRVITVVAMRGTMVFPGGEVSFYNLWALYALRLQLRQYYLKQKANEVKPSLISIISSWLGHNFFIRPVGWFLKSVIYGTRRIKRFTKRITARPIRLLERRMLMFRHSESYLYMVSCWTAFKEMHGFRSRPRPKAKEKPIPIPKTRSRRAWRKYRRTLWRKKRIETLTKLLRRVKVSAYLRNVWKKRPPTYIHRLWARAYFARGYDEQARSRKVKGEK